MPTKTANSTTIVTMPNKQHINSRIYAQTINIKEGLSRYLENTLTQLKLSTIDSTTPPQNSKKIACFKCSEIPAVPFKFFVDRFCSMGNI